MVLTAAPGRRRAPLVALAVVALLAGLWGGLIRLGLRLPETGISTAELHGPLMALGFLGTLISLERSVALGRAWAYVAPVATGAGAVAAMLHAPGDLGPVLIAAGGLVLSADHLVLHRLAPSAHNLVMALGALAWCAAAGLWLAGADVARFAPLMAGFLVLTIVGERLELTRVTRRPVRVRAALGAAIGVFIVGLAVSVRAERLGLRVAGAGLVAQAFWLLRHDVARRTVRMTAVTRYIAVALLAGYVWLLCGGVLWLLWAPVLDGAAYDAALHAVFLGFVMSMVFAHAPVIVPAVLRTPLPYRRAFYVHVALLHAGLALRLAGGDLAGNTAMWRAGGIANETAILLFLAATAGGVAATARRRRRPGDRGGRRAAPEGQTRPAAMTDGMLGRPLGDG